MEADRRHARPAPLRRRPRPWVKAAHEKARATRHDAPRLPRAAGWQRLMWALAMGSALTMVALGAQAGRNAACAAAAPGPDRPAGLLRTLSGDCSLTGAVQGDLVAAVSPAEYAGSAACGAYLDVTGPRGIVRVQVVDECRSCAAGELDLSRPAFARIAAPGHGVVPVDYHRVRNPEVARPVAFRLKRGSSADWLAIQAVDHGNPLRRLQILRGGLWRDLSRASDNYWVAGDGAGAGPYSVRITDVYGQRLVATGIHLSPGGLQRTTRRLYAPSSSSPAPSTWGAAARRTAGNMPARRAGGPSHEGGDASSSAAVPPRGAFAPSGGPGPSGAGSRHGGGGDTGGPSAGVPADRARPEDGTTANVPPGDGTTGSGAPGGRTPGNGTTANGSTSHGSAPNGGTRNGETEEVRPGGLPGPGVRPSPEGTSGGGPRPDASSDAPGPPGARPADPRPGGTAPIAGAAGRPGGTASGGMPGDGGESSRAVADGPGRENGAARGTLDVYPGGSSPAAGRAPLTALPSVRPFFC
ncbi:expansin EXLX1 family cellulose-binding protein [Sphaerisporangium dianthi]|uniref:Expansin EXLX1 family cellulose-binding protein n=1 Tax=Sphaerisporangium dianthi TaxID=1436120 RepID=A0ABV9CHL9_9ACTN